MSLVVIWTQRTARERALEHSDAGVRRRRRRTSASAAHSVAEPTRQIVLRGVDGIVFVADSQYEKMEENIETFKHLQDNLKALNINLEDIPYVVQYNKRDMPDVAPVEYLDFLLNNREVQVPSFEASASKCEGVFETLNMITRMLLHKFLNDGVRTR